MTASPPSRRPVVPAGPRIEARARAARSARRRRWFARTTRALCAVIPVAALVWLALFSSLLGVHRYALTGLGRLSAAQITAAAAVPDGTPLARIDVGAVARRLRALPAVEAAVVTRGWPTTLRIQIVERTPVVAILAAGHWNLVDRFGVDFASAPTLPAGLIRLQVGANDPGGLAARAGIAVLLELPPTLRSQLATVRAASPIAVTLGLRDGRDVVWGAPDGAANKAAAAERLLTLPGKVIDVSAPGVAIRRS